MNQILDYNPNKSSGSGKSSGSDKIVRIFAVILVVFALCLVCSGIYGMVNNKKKAVSETNTPTQAVIKVERDQNDETKAIIKVSHDKAIEKVIYTWDNDKDIINKGNGQPTMEIEISLPAGTHTLTVKVTDIDGNDTIYDEEIYSENGEDKVNPEIQTTVDQATKKIVITATDDTALDYITYRWNDEEEQRIDADSENPKEIKYEIEIPKGTNDLTIIAVDKNNNQARKSDKYTGVTKPEVTLTVSEDKKRIDVHCYHENGIKEISLSINDGDPMFVNLGEETRTEADFYYDKFTQPNNNVVVKVVSVDGTETEVKEEIISEESQEESNIEILLEKQQDADNQVNLSIKSEVEIESVTVVANDKTYDLPASGLKEANTSVPLYDDVTKVTVTVKTTDGSEKIEEQEFTMGE